MPTSSSSVAVLLSSEVLLMHLAGRTDAHVRPLRDCWAPLLRMCVSVASSNILLKMISLHSVSHSSQLLCRLCKEASTALRPHLLTALINVHQAEGVIKGDEKALRVIETTLLHDGESLHSHRALALLYAYQGDEQRCEEHARALYFGLREKFQLANNSDRLHSVDLSEHLQALCSLPQVYQAAELGELFIDVAQLSVVSMQSLPRKRKFMDAASGQHMNSSDRGTEHGENAATSVLNTCFALMAQWSHKCIIAVLQCFAQALAQPRTISLSYNALVIFADRTAGAVMCLNLVLPTLPVSFRQQYASTTLVPLFHSVIEHVTLHPARPALLLLLAKLVRDHVRSITYSYSFAHLAEFFSFSALRIVCAARAPAYTGNLFRARACALLAAVRMSHAPYRCSRPTLCAAWLSASFIDTCSHPPQRCCTTVLRDSPLRGSGAPLWHSFTEVLPRIP